MRVTQLALIIATVCSSTAVLAENTSFATSTKESKITTSLDAVTVTATRTEKTALESKQAVNVITSADIERNLSTSVFDSLIMVPNTSATGGPRAAGQKFSIRGFSDAEDVLVTVDGAIQTFEKYRMGSFFGDPSLYRSISVKRGPSTVLHGGGALGGLVQAELKNASDFLDPDEQAGAKVNLGFNSNNKQKNGSITAYAKAIEDLDLLLSYSNRDSDDFELSNGETLENSAIASESFLLKGEYYLTDAQLLTLSYNQTEDSQRTEFNTTDEGSWGTVYRTVAQKVTNLGYEFSPENNDYINLKATLGYSQSHVTESDGSGFLKDFVGLESNYEYNILTFDLLNTTMLGLHTLTYGLQASNKERIGEKLSFDCTDYDTSTRSCNAYADVATIAEMSSQPSGQQDKVGIYIQDEFTWQALTLTAGVRYEKYDSSATDKFNLQHPTTNNDVSHSEVVSAFSAGYQLTDQLSVFANHQQGFRAPLIDEIYDQYQGRNPNLTLDNELSTSTEIGAIWQQNEIFSTEDVLTARFIYFDISVDDEIVSHTNAGTNPVPNPRYNNSGSNDRDGIELEINYANSLLFANVTYSNISGEDQDSELLWYLPADKLALDTGFNFVDNTVQTGLRLVHNSERDVQVYDSASRSYSVGQHDSYSLVDLFVSWDISAVLNVRLAVDNVLDEEYQVRAGTGGAIGDYGIGRNIKTQVSYQF
jgi:hemoglobin/transferrin/lactoferrin receptor protein